MGIGSILGPAYYFQMKWFGLVGGVGDVGFIVGGCGSMRRMRASFGLIA